MIRVTYTSKSFREIDIVRRYVRVGEPAFVWCEVDSKGRDIRQGTCDESDLSPVIVEAARKYRGWFPSWVAWPRDTVGARP